MYHTFNSNFLEKRKGTIMQYHVMPSQTRTIGLMFQWKNMSNSNRIDPVLKTNQILQESNKVCQIRVSFVYDKTLR